jgi:hypothetical protein
VPSHVNPSSLKCFPWSLSVRTQPRVCKAGVGASQSAQGASRGSIKIPFSSRPPHKTGVLTWTFVRNNQDHARVIHSADRLTYTVMRRTQAERPIKDTLLRTVGLTHFQCHFRLIFNHDACIRPETSRLLLRTRPRLLLSRFSHRDDGLNVYNERIVANRYFTRDIEWWWAGIQLPHGPIRSFEWRDLVTLL